MDIYDKPQFRGGVLLTEMSTPATPPSNTVAIFTGTDGYLYYKDDAGNVVGLRPPPIFQMCQVTEENLTTIYDTYASNGQPSFTMTVPNSGVIECTFGMVGQHGGTGGAQLYVDMQFTGANTRDPSDTDSACNMFAPGNTGLISVEKTLLLTGLNPGSTYITLKARTSNTTGESLRESWLLVQPLP